MTNRDANSLARGCPTNILANNHEISSSSAKTPDDVQPARKDTDSSRRLRTIDLPTILAAHYPIMATLVSYLNADDLWSLRIVSRSLHTTFYTRPAVLGYNTYGCQGYIYGIDGSRSDCPKADPKLLHKLIRCQGHELGYANLHGEHYYMCPDCAAMPGFHLEHFVERTLKRAAVSYCNECNLELLKICKSNSAVKRRLSDFDAICGCMKPSDVTLCCDCHKSRAKHHMVKGQAAWMILHESWMTNNPALAKAIQDSGHVLAAFCPRKQCTSYLSRAGSNLWQYSGMNNCLAKCPVCSKIMRHDGLNTIKRVVVENVARGLLFPPYSSR